MTEKELRLIEWATTDIGLARVFNFTNFDDKSFIAYHGLSKEEIQVIGRDLRKKILNELSSKSKIP